MREPKEKSLNPLMPKVFIRGIHNQLRRFDGRRVGDPRPCPECSCEQLRQNGYDYRTFARLVTDNGLELLEVEVQLYQYSTCEHSFQADLSEWFYEDLHYAKPIVDLCLFHASEQPYHACERLLQNQYGLHVDRDTIRNYAIEFGDEIAEQHGVTIAGATASQNFLSFLFGVETVEELTEEYAEELDAEGIEDLVGVADETYPAKKGAKKDLYEENMGRKQEGEEPRKRPDSYTLGFSYLPQLGCFAGVQCRNTGFAEPLALALVAPLEGGAYWVTDDNDAYADLLPNRFLCIVHELRKRAREDERVEELCDEGALEELHEYLSSAYSELYEEVVQQLRQVAPSLWDESEERFSGAVSTNAIEGGNWRMKRGLGVGYARCRSARARTVLMAFRDSVSTFSAGNPDESFACRYSDARFEDVLGANEQPSEGWEVVPSVGEREAAS